MTAGDENETDPKTAGSVEADDADMLDVEAAAAEAMDGLEPPILERRETGQPNRHKRAIFGVPVEVVIAVGRANPSIGELLNLSRDALLTLDAKIEDPVDIMVGKRVIARGELQEIEDGDGRLGVRLTEIVDLSEPF